MLAKDVSSKGLAHVC